MRDGFKLTKLKLNPGAVGYNGQGAFMYITNSFSLNMLADTQSAGIIIKEIPLVRAREMAHRGVESAVGHGDTAAVFSDQLGVEILPVRTTISLKKGERVLVGQYIGPRMPEGCKSLPDGAIIKWLQVDVAVCYVLTGENDLGYPEWDNEVWSDGPLCTYGPLHLK